MKRTFRLLGLVAALFALSVVTGCQAIADKAAEKAAEAAVEHATGVDIDKNGEDVTITSEDGSATFSDTAELPEDFPKDVPIYENASIEGAFTNEVDAGKSYVVSMKSEDDAAEIFDWYKSAYEDKGWEITATMEVGDSVGGLSAEKGDLTSTISIGYGSEKQADISITVSPKQ